MRRARINRLFRANGRCVILAFDHGLFGEPSWLAGLEEMPTVISGHAAEHPDGMTLPSGSARLLQSVKDHHKPSLLLRADCTDAYLSARSSQPYAHALNSIVDRAVALDAACVVAALVTFPGQATLTRDCFASIDALRARCDPVGMPLMVEILAMTDNDGVPLVQTAATEIAPLVRQAMELGADIIKADPTLPVDHFAEIIEAAAGVPVLASGGIKASDVEVLERTAALMHSGASGIAYGRNVMWAKQPTLMTRALLRIVHDDCSAAQALASAGLST